MSSTITRQDIISDDALMAPLILAKNMEEALAAMKKISAEGKKSSEAVDNSKSTGKVRVVVDDLTASQKELNKISAQIATATAKNNKEYIAQEAALKKVKKELKDRTDLGDKDAKTVTRQTASLKELEAALRINREAFANLRTEEERTSEAGIELLKTIQEQADGVAELRESIKQFGHNVGDYAGQILRANKEIKRLETETKALIKAQKKADQTTDEGKKAYKQYNTQIQQNITQINIYRNAVAKASKEQEKLNKSSKGGGGGGGITDALGGIGDLSPQLGEATSKVTQLSGAFKSLLASPVGAFLAVIAAGVAAVSAYFTGSIEGQDRWGRKMVWLTSFTTVFRLELEKVGKYLVDMWDKPKEAVEAFGTFIFNNLLNRVKAIIVLGQAIGKAFTGDFKEAAKSVADAVYQFYTGITNITGKYASFKAKVDADQAKRDLIEIRNQQFKKDSIQDIIDDSITELEVAKLLAKVKDDLRYADEDRLKALRKANDLLEEQAQGDIELAKEELAIAKDLAKLEQEAFERANKGTMTAEELAKHKQTTYEEEQKIAELTAKVNKTQEEFFLKQKKRLTEEFATVREIHDKRMAIIKAQQDAYDKLETWRLEAVVENSRKVLDTEQSSLAERYKAIVETTTAQVTLAQEASEKELAAALEAAKGRVNLSTQERKEIYMNRQLSIDEQLALEEQYKTERALIDQAYVVESIAIEEKRLAEIKRINEEGNNLTRENALFVLMRDNEKWADQFAAATADAMRALNDEYAKGTISTEEYLKRREDLEKQANTNSIWEQLQYVNAQLKLAEEGSMKQLDLMREQAELELALQDETIEKKLEREQAYQDAVDNLKATARDSALEVMDNLFEAEDMKREERLAKLANAEAMELQMAGDNEEAKAEIQNRYALQNEALRKQQVAADRKKAIFDKSRAAVEIAINTAVAISKAARDYGFPLAIPFIAIAAATGAVQLAAVLSRPIPSYAKGTENHPGGLAVVGEKGPERVTLPNGNSFMTPGKDTLMDLPAGTKVETNAETMRALAREGMRVTDTVPRGTDYSKQLSKQTEEIQALHHTLKHKKELHINYTRRGAEAVLEAAHSRSRLLNQFYR